MPIVGLGTDIVQIERIQAAVSRSDRFAERILTKNEYELFKSHPQSCQYLAKRFAAKEAAVKAFGTGCGKGISWQQIEVTNNESGAPQLTFSGRCAELCEQLNITNALISISDEKDYAVATVILES